MITRENYEEFFLSYVDNELPAETRLAVEHFVAANPDLGDELETLLQCRLEPASDTVFPGKQNLLQYEESLLSYLDGELDEAGRKTIEELMRQEPHYARELKRLRNTVSEPDAAIVFPDKESLYHPVKGRRVIMLPWLRATAAAAVIGVAVVLLLPHGRRTGVPSEAVVKNASPVVTPAATSPLYPGKNAPTANKPKTTNAANGTMILAHAPGATNTTPLAANGTHRATHAAVGPTEPVSTDPATASNGLTAATTPASNSTAAANSTAAGNSTAAANSATASNSTAGSNSATGSNSAAAANSTAGSNSATASNSATGSNPATASDPTASSRTEKAAATALAVVNIPKEQRSFATQALLREAQDEGDGEMAGNAPPTTGKTKLRGLFRRVTRTFGKTAGRDGDGERQVSISVFQVALK